MELSQFKNKFIEDSNVLLNNLERDIMELEHDKENSNLIENIFRVMHTLKGVSSMYGFDNIGELTHKLENIFDAVRNKEILINKNILDITLAACDLIKNLLEDENFIDKKNIETFNSIENKIDTCLKKSGIKITLKKNRIKKFKGKTATFNIIFFPDDNIIARNINIIEQFRELFALGEHQIIKPDFGQNREQWSIFLVTDRGIDDIEEALFFILDECKIHKIADFNIFNDEEADKFNQQFADAIESKKTETKEIKHEETEKIDIAKSINLSKQNTGRIAVDTLKLDKLMYLVSELITTNSQLNLITKDEKYEPIKQYLNKINNLSTEFRNNAIDIRLVPISDMALRFQRLIRDLSAHLEKEIDFITQGTNTELDKNTVDLLQEPLMHIIRNCIDHGIKTPQERKKIGKEPKGLIKLVAFHSGNNVFIQIQDDGQGIDPELIKQKAVEKKLISPNQEITEEELLDLIFLPGFSTAQSLTEVSGRGVGLDVVRKNITELRGEIEVKSEIGLGTSFTIKLQQSLAIMDTMLFNVDQTHFLIPLENVESITVLETDYILERQRSKTLPYNNNLIPFIDLRKTFKKNTNYPKTLEVIIVNKNEKLFAIVTDRIIGEHQAVLKNIAKEYKELEYLSGASILPDGNIAMMLDPGMLYDRIKDQT